MNKTLWIKREWQYFRSSHLLIVATIVLGLSGVFLIEKLKDSFLTSLRDQEKELLSSDFALTARRPLNQKEIELFESKLDGKIEKTYSVLDMSSMLYAPNQESSHLVEVRVIEPGFPFYGKLENSEGTLKLNPDHSLFSENCLWLHDEAVRLLGINLGDPLFLGEGEFKYCGNVTVDSTQGFRGFSLAARVYLGRSNLAKTQLVGEGSIASHSFHVKFNQQVAQESIDRWQEDLIRQFDDPSIRVQKPTDSSEQVARSGKIFGDYLQLASLVALLLSVVGTFYLFRTLVLRRHKDIAILRSLGVSPSESRLLLLLPLVFDFLISLPMAWIFSTVLFPIMGKVMFQLFGASLNDVGFPWQIWPSLPLIFGLILSVLLPSIEESLRTPIIGLIHNQDKMSSLSRVQTILWSLLSLAFFILLSIWAAHSWKIGLLFVAGLIASLILLISVSFGASYLGRITLKGSQSLSKPFGLMLGLVIRRLIRRPVTTVLTMVALGLGSVLVSFLGHLELSLNKEFSLTAKDKPTLFLFDIQDDQTHLLTEFLKNNNTDLQALSPMVRGKLISINEKIFKQDEKAKSFQTREDEMNSRFRQRMMNLSWAEKLNPTEKLIEGVEFKDSKVAADESAISLEQRFAQRLGISLGDRLKFEVLGMPVIGKVVNIRSVKWTSFRPNFFIVFAPGALEEAPKTWLASIGKLSASEKAKLQNLLSKKFPNISAVDVEQLVARILQLFERLKKALELMAYFSFAVGIIVVAAMAQDQVIRRQKEVMLEKALGLSPLRVTLMVLGEFLLLSFMAFLFGGIAGGGIAGLVTHFIFEGTVIWSLKILILSTIGGMTLVSIPLLFMGRRIFTWRPAGLLQGA
ncbi:MAG: hypothetical protein K2P81_13625 [Bacteriovoracaceae bacterium]|nr:hypothetical protein [Bacteriovoracaceae bacterium]